MSDIVIHPEGADGRGFSICGGLSGGQVRGAPWWSQPHCPSCTCSRQPAREEHGTWVTCRCGRTGIVPDKGHEIDFLPPGTAWEGTTLIFRP